MDFSKINPDFRKEIVREGTTHLDGQIKILTAADARASGLAGMFTAAGTALTAGVVIALFNPAWAVPARIPLTLGGAVAAACFFIAAWLCIAAIFPVGVWLPGLAPENWTDDVAQGRALEDCLSERARHIQEQIDDNSKVIETNAKRFKWGARFGISAPIVGTITWLLASACRLGGP